MTLLLQFKLNCETSVLQKRIRNGDLILTDITEGEIVIEDISIKGQDRAANDLSSYVAFTKLDGLLNKVGPTVKLTDRDQLVAIIRAP